MCAFNATNVPKPGYEPVFTISDYHDGPRRGIANFHGTPHFYDRLFDEKRAEYSDSYLLTPINEQVFKAARKAGGFS